MEIKKTDEKFLNKTFQIGNISTASKRKVGALITDKEGMTLSTGYNFNPKNGGNCENEKGETYDTVIHAEANCISKLDKIIIPMHHQPHTIYVSYSPCMNCCKLIVGVGIKKLVFHEKHKTNFDTLSEGYTQSPKQFLESNGVEVIHLPQKKTALVYHSSDPDGLMSAYLLENKYKNEIAQHLAELIPCNYKNYDFLNLEKYNKFIFVDIYPPIEWLIDNYEVIKNQKLMVNIFDHHKGFNEKIMGSNYLNNLPYSNYSNNLPYFNYHYREKISACLLYNNLIDNHFSDVKKFIINMICELISEYDIYAFIDYTDEEQKNKVIAFSEYLFQFKTYPEFKKVIDEIVEQPLLPVGISRAFDLGFETIEKIKYENNLLINTGILFTKEKCFVFEGKVNYYLPEQINEEYKKYDEIDYLLAYQHYDKNADKKLSNYKFSIRSYTDKEPTAKQLAMTFPNGGGHEHAGGFMCSKDVGEEIINNPKYLFERFERLETTKKTKK